MPQLVACGIEYSHSRKMYIRDVVDGIEREGTFPLFNTDRDASSFEQNYITPYAVEFAETFEKNLATKAPKTRSSTKSFFVRLRDLASLWQDRQFTHQRTITPLPDKAEY